MDWRKVAATLADSPHGEYLKEFKRQPKLFEEVLIYAKKRSRFQGFGNVGSKLANILFWEGANLILTDVDTHKAHEHAILFSSV